MYLIPTDDAFVEDVAKAIARNRMHSDASDAMRDLIGVPLDATAGLEGAFDRIFESLWNGELPHDDLQRQTYRNDALAAIRVINMKLITSPG